MTDFTGGRGRDIYTGTPESDRISGGGGADTLSGGDHDDFIASADIDPVTGFYIDTGAERDTLNGGPGDDVLYAGYGDNVDGGSNYQYSKGDFLFVSFMGAPAGVTVNFSETVIRIGGGTIQNVENLSWVQGSNFADTINAADRSAGYSDFNTVLGMGGDDHLIGGYYTKAIDGGEGDDMIDVGAAIYTPVLRGGAGNDTIKAITHSATVYGDEGNDRIDGTGETHGGAGHDTIIAHQANWRGAMLGEDGNDKISAADDFALTAFGGAGADKLIGNAADDQLSTDILPDPLPDNVYYGYHDDYGADRDTVDAGAGDDLIAAGYGDKVDGGAGTDRLRLTLAGVGKGITLALAKLVAADGTAFGGGKITGIEIIELVGTTNFADSVRVAGTRLPLTLNTLGGNDTIRSDGAAITINGGDGEDRLLSTKSDGIFNGGAGYDKADFGKASAKVTVLLYVRPEDFDWPDPYWQEPTVIAGVAQLSSVEEVLGSAFGDKITGNRGDNLLKGMGGDDQLLGGDGADTLDGGAGTDRLDGGAGDDTYVITDALDRIVEAAGGGSDTVRTAVTWKLATNIENLTLTGSGAANGTGNAAANVLTGNAGANVLEGFNANDVLDGGAGVDRLDGGAGDDIYLVRAYGDRTAAEIFDSRASLRDEVRIAADGPGLFTAYAGESGIDRIVIGKGTYTIADRSGTAAINVDAAALTRSAVIIGNAGNNSLTGTSKADLIGGGPGGDTLAGGDGADTLFGQDGADTLRGGGAADLLYGGVGSDTLTGGLGADTFAIGTDPFEGVDMITDFASGSDKLLVINSYLSGILLSGGFRYGTSAGDNDDLAIYDKGSGRLYVDYDANGPQAQVLLATFTPGTNLAASDILLIEAGSFQQQTSAAQQELLL